MRDGLAEREEGNLCATLRSSKRILVCNDCDEQSLYISEQNLFRYRGGSLGIVLYPHEGVAVALLRCFASDSHNRELEELALTAMASLDPPRLLDTVRSHNMSMCGVLPAVIVMETLRCLNQLTHTERSGYATSADVSGDKTRVVGYAGMLLGYGERQHEKYPLRLRR